MSHPINDWKRLFLLKRDLERPTGGPLYSYRMTSSEFDDLAQILKDRLAIYLDMASLGDVARHIPFFPALFVLYASEWWHRRYDGSGWSWDPIISGLGVEGGSWTQAQRSECVEKGLQDWRLQLTNLHGLRFLGSIAFQGGLPMQLLASARGNIGRVLGRVLRLAATGNFEAKDVQGWVESLSSYLPNAYRQTEIYILLTEVILSVLRLKRAAQLTSADGAIEALNRFDPNWRNYFPIPIEDAQAQGLIDQLIRDAADAKLSQQIRNFSVERRLEIIDGNQWQIRSDIDLPEYIEASQLSNMFSTEALSLTRTLTLRVSRNDQTVELGLRKLAGQERYRIERRPLETRNHSAIAEHTAALITSDGKVIHSMVARGEALSSDLPWLMEPLVESTFAFRFVRQGGGSLSSLEAVVAAPDTWTFQPDAGGEAVRLGELTVQNRTVWKVRGIVRIDDNSGHHFRIRCGQAAAEDHLEWRGGRIWETFCQPSLAFRGAPKLYRVSDTGLVQPVSGSISWRVPGGRSTLTPSGLAGPIDAIWPAEGETKWRSRLVLLPENASIKIEPGDSPSSGRLIFSNYGLLAVQIDGTDISLGLEHEGEDAVVHVNYRGLGSPPEWFDLTLLWRGNPNSAIARIPFPAKGCRAFDGNGQQLVDGELIPVRNIIGVRLVGFLGNSYSAELRLSLHNGNASSAVSTVIRIIKAGIGENRVEIRLIDYAQEMQRMLADADGLDATVRLRLQVGGFSTTLRIARYACELDRYSSLPGVGLSKKALAKLSPDEVAAIPVRALRMDAPGDEPITLVPSFSEGVATGSWIFPIQSLSPGPWLIYAGSDSLLSFRPLLWQISSDDVPQSTDQKNTQGLLEALRLPDEFLRQQAIDTLISDLAGSFVHADWQVIEQIAGHLGHLPLSTMDLWRRFARSNEGMAALAMKLGTWPTGFVERFSTELPMMWETISLNIWRNSMDSLLRQCDTWYGKEVSKTVFNSHLERRVQDITSANPALRVLLEIAKAKVTGIITQEILIAQQEFMEVIFARQLFDGADCYLQQLLRNNAEAQWPVGFKDEIDMARHNGMADYLGHTGSRHHDVVINIPILLAIGAVMNTPLEWCHEAKAVRELRTIQTFDPEWFVEAFDLTVARCIAKKVVQI